MGYRRCGYSRVAMAPGGAQSIGSRAQTWNHDQGMLQNRAENSCLGVAKTHWYSTEGNSDLDSAKTYSVRLYSCNKEDVSQRWLLGDDDRMHSVANYDLCLTIQSDDTGVLLEEGAPIQLSPCTTDEDEEAHRQRLQVIGADTSMEAFVYPTQSEYGVGDTVRLAFWTDKTTDEDTEDERSATKTLEVFAASEEGVDISATMKSVNDDKEGMTPLYTQSVSSNANIVEIDAVDLLASLPQDEASTTRFIARLGSVESAPFTVNTQEEHVKTSCSFSGTFLIVAMSVVGGIALLFAGLFAARRLRLRRRPTRPRSGKRVVTSASTQDDEETQASSDEEDGQINASSGMN